MASVKVVEVCRVTPHSESPKSATEFSLPLTFFDIFWLKSGPVERIFFYELPDLTPTTLHAEILPKLKHTLSLTLLHFLPLAGGLTWLPDAAKPIILYTPGDGVSLTVVESDGASFDVLSSSEMHDALISRPYVPKLSMSDHEPKVSVLSLQISLFPNKGFAIGCTTHHGAVDGKSSILFMKAWAHICKQNSDLLPTELSPRFDSAVVQDPEGIDMEYLKGWASMTKAGSDPKAESLKWFPVTEPPPDSVRATFKFSREDIKRLRERVLSLIDNSGDTESIHLSTFVLTFSYASVCLVKARGLKRDEKIKFGIVADCRARLDPPSHPNYFGNCVVLQLGLLEVEGLIQDHGIVLAVQKLSEIIKGLEKGALEGAKEKVKKLRTAEPVALTIGIAGSPRFEVYGIDFGWGRPKNVEITSAGGGTFSMAESRDGDGGVEIVLVLKKEEMEKFESLFVDGLKG